MPKTYLAEEPGLFDVVVVVVAKLGIIAATARAWLNSFRPWWLQFLVSLLLAARLLVVILVGSTGVIPATYIVPLGLVPIPIGLSCCLLLVWAVRILRAVAVGGFGLVCSRGALA